MSNDRNHILFAHLAKFTMFYDKKVGEKVACQCFIWENNKNYWHEKQKM